jgi:pyridinium-3,5-biscarboxylic acid mononucleotide synthase
VANETAQRMHRFRSLRRALGSASTKTRLVDGDNGVLARLDTARAARAGFPEVIFAEGKSNEQLLSIVKTLHMSATKDEIIASRVSQEQYEYCNDLLTYIYSSGDRLIYYKDARIMHIAKNAPSLLDGKSATMSKVCILTAGTSDSRVAAEAEVLLQLSSPNSEILKIQDVGVAGIHRVLEQVPAFSNADVIIVVAGMDGALPSVVGGLVKCPVIAVPTSVGYGAAFGGVAPLLTMLNSCSPGVSVVNIDNGFGAAVVAHKILQGLEAARRRKNEE